MLKKIGLDSKVGFYLRDGIFSTNYGIVTLLPIEGLHWFCYFEDCYFDSYGCPPPGKLLKFQENKHRNCIDSEYQIQKNDSFCASYVLFRIYLTKVEGLDFKSAVLNLYYQMVQKR